MINSQRDFSLDFLRSCAILLVVASHAAYLLTHTFPTAKRFYEIGFFGVELFFALSGFLIYKISITENSKNQKFSSIHFIVFRWARTLPLYFLFLLIHAVIAKITGIPTANIVPYLFFCQSLAWTHPLFFPESWSLAVEEWFYLTIALSLSVWWRIRHQKVLSYIAVIIIVIAFLARGIGVIFFDMNWETIRKGVLFRLDSLFIGLLVATVTDSCLKWKTSHKTTLLFMILFCILGLAVWYTEEKVNGNPALIIALPLIISLLMAGLVLCMSGSCEPALLWKKLFELISRCSYAMYLWNFPLLILFAVIQQAFKLFTPINIFQIMVAYFASVFILSICTYYFFESKMTNFFRDIAKNKIITTSKL